MTKAQDPRIRKVRSDAQPTVALVCEHCGKGFSRERYRINPGPVYCSRRCSGASKRGSYRTEENKVSHGQKTGQESGCLSSM